MPRQPIPPAGVETVLALPRSLRVPLADLLGSTPHGLRRLIRILPGRFGGLGEHAAGLLVELVESRAQFAAALRPFFPEPVRSIDRCCLRPRCSSSSVRLTPTLFNFPFELIPIPHDFFLSKLIILLQARKTEVLKTFTPQLDDTASRGAGDFRA